MTRCSDHFSEVLIPLAFDCPDSSRFRSQIDLLIDMVTLANLDCDKLEDELTEVERGMEPKR